MTLETLTLTLNPGEADERQYEVTMLQSVDLSSTKEAFSIAPPGVAASQNLFLGVSGMNADVAINWRVHDDGTDKANGTHTETVVTIEEQITYLEDTMHAPDFGASWQINHETGNAFSDDEVFFESFDVPVIQRESPKWRDATMRLRRGQSLG